MAKSIVRISSFFTKEITEMLRQPMLVLRLILGPFLILLLVGIGYSYQARSLRAYMVTPENEPETAKTIQSYVDNLGPAFQVVGSTTSENEALQRLKAGQADVVVVVPAKAYETVLNGSQAVLKLYHNEIDPTQAAYVEQFGRVYVQEINRRIMESFAERVRQDSANSQQDLEKARSSLTVVRQAMQAGDETRAREEMAKATASIDRATLVLGAGALIMGSVGQGLGLQDPYKLQVNSVGQQPADASLASTADSADKDLATLDEQLKIFQRIPAPVLISPLTVEAKNAATYVPNFMTFYAPGVLALILQHIAVSIGALALVRERFFGAIELFRVGPISAFEILLGKYASYMAFIAVLAAILTAAIVYLLKVPLFGDLASLALSMLLLIFASLGIGMAISATSGSDSQAIQMSMLVLLASMFFSGFFFPLSAILMPVRYIGFALPVTYGILNFQNVMLKGLPPLPYYLMILLAIGVGLFLFTWLRYRRAIIKA